MSIRVFAWDANPAIDRHLYKQSDAEGQSMFIRGKAEAITLPDGRRALQLTPPIDQRVGTKGALVPFSRVLNKLKHPPSINYPIPACGARDRHTSVFSTNHLQFQ